MTTKICKKCKREFLATTKYFYKQSGGKLGLRATCKECEMESRKTTMKKYYNDNREKLLEYQKKYRLENPEKCNKPIDKETKHQYYLNTREKALKRQQKYRLENKEKIKRYRVENKNVIFKNNKTWRIENKEQKNILNQKANARKLNLQATLTFKEWQEIKEKFNNKCAYCGEEKPLEMEHVIPVSKGGGFIKNNIVPSCKSCNCDKRQSDFVEWYRNKEFYSKEREKNILEHVNQE